MIDGLDQISGINKIISNTLLLLLSVQIDKFIILSYMKIISFLGGELIYLDTTHANVIGETISYKKKFMTNTFKPSDEVVGPVYVQPSFNINKILKECLKEGIKEKELNCRISYLSECISDFMLPPGLYLFSGGSTGLGKSNFIQGRIQGYNATASFSIKAIMAQQIKELSVKMSITEAEAEKLLVQAENVKQALEKARLGEIKEFHFDEIQVTYEAGYREVMEDVVNNMKEMAKLIPVCCYSATYIDELSLIDFDFIFRLKNNFRRKIDIHQIISKEQDELFQVIDAVAEERIAKILKDTKLSEKEIKELKDKIVKELYEGRREKIKGVKLDQISQLADIIVDTAKRTGLKVLFFLNNEALGIILAAAIEKIKIENSDKTFKHLRVEVVTSEKLKTTDKSIVPQAKDIIDKSRWVPYTVLDKSVGLQKSTVRTEEADVIITTISMEAGINIKNKIAIGCLQTAPEKVFQQLGRARGDGYFFLIAGRGNYKITPRRKSRVSREHSIANKKCRFRDDFYTSCADGFSEYESRCKLSSAADYVVRRLDELGYTPIKKDPIKAATLKNDRSSARKFKEMYLASKNEGIIPSTEEVATKLKINIKKAEEYIDTFKKLYGFFDDKSPEESVDIVYKNLAYSKIQYFCELLDNKEDYSVITELAVKYQKGYKSRLDKGMGGFEQKNIDAMNRDFWMTVFKINSAEDELNSNLRSYLQLFKLLIGMEYNEKSERFEMKAEIAFWDVPLEQGSESVKWSKLSKVAKENNLTGADLCEHTQLNRKEYTNMFNVKSTRIHCAEIISQVKF